VERWKPVLEKLNDIPTLPVVATRVTELINDPNSSSSDIADVLKKDQVLTAKVLKLINSPYYGIPGEVTDVKHALGTAVASEVIARKTGYPKPEECFTCGLLHDIGKIVLLKVAPEEFMGVLRLAEAEKISFAEAERRLEVPTHGYLGEYIADKWRLPMVIRMSIRYHHTDVNGMETILESIKRAVQTVALANQIVVRENIGFSGDASGGIIGPPLFEPLGLLEADIPPIVARVQKDFDNASSFLRSAA
jgi:HD-like signal output (HDOD) protein